MSRKHVMVVDDDQDIREGVAMALEIEGYDVYSARNGLEAWETLTHLAEEELPGCILLDLNMPVMDGVTFLHKLEEMKDKVADIPVCVASANYNIPAIDLAHATRTLRKPFNIDQIYHVVHDFCGLPQ